MAERILCKITRGKLIKFLSNRYLSMISVERNTQSYSETMSDSVREDNKSREASSSTIKTLTVPKIVRITNEAQLFKENARKQHLQPCLLPKFYRSNMNFSSVDTYPGYSKKF